MLLPDLGACGLVASHLHGGTRPSTAMRPIVQLFLVVCITVVPAMLLCISSANEVDNYCNGWRQIWQMFDALGGGVPPGHVELLAFSSDSTARSQEEYRFVFVFFCSSVLGGDDR